MATASPGWRVMMTLHRIYTPTATLGVLRLADSPVLFECATIEREWDDNAVGESCIPEGEYVMRLRSSPVVQRSSGGEFEEGWEVTDVESRTFIMLHPANYAAELNGCIAPGRHIASMNDQLAVTHSRDTFRELMGLLDRRDEWTITISGVNSHA